MGGKSYCPRRCEECMYLVCAVWDNGSAPDTMVDERTGKSCSSCYFRRADRFAENGKARQRASFTA
jgi:hypothetical protein